MVIEIIEKYVNELIDKSTLDEPVWNIEKIRAGKKASWDYIDGCMIMSLLELYKVTKIKNILILRRSILTIALRRMEQLLDIRKRISILTISMRVRICLRSMI